MERRTVNVNGLEASVRIGGEGPVLLLIHGMAGSSTDWNPVLDGLLQHATVIAPDLPGHGKSDKPRGDYSLGSQASFLRDLLAILGHDGATVLGTSLGGGIAMQFTYQYPHLCERLILVGAGGLGEEVNPLLRALALPGAGLLLPLGTQPFMRTGVETVTGWFSRIGLAPEPRAQQIWRSYTSLMDRDTRSAFLLTLRSVVDVGGQRVSAEDKLYLAADVPTMIVWGDDDPIIPVEHAHRAHGLIEGSRLELMAECGHFPYVDEPKKFVEIVSDFIATTDAAKLTAADLAIRLTEVESAT